MKTAFLIKNRFPGKRKQLISPCRQYSTQKADPQRAMLDNGLGSRYNIGPENAGNGFNYRENRHA